MKKIIPVITIIVAVLLFGVAVMGLISVSLAVTVPNITFAAVPTVIVGAVFSFASAPLAYLFKRDRLCFIAFFIDLASAVISVVSVIVWLAAL